MDPVYSLQDVIRCHLCDIPQPSKHCDLCHVHLCEDCEEKHLSNVFKEHYIVPFKMRGSTSKCSKHTTKICELFCEYCDIPICLECASSTEHEQHGKSTILESLLRKKKMIQIDLEELEELINPSYDEAASNILVQIADLKQNSQKLKISLNNKAQTLHSEIDTIIEKMQSDSDDMHSKHLAVIQKHKKFIAESKESISRVILRMRKLLDANDVLLVSKYISRNHYFKTLSINIQATLPRFTPTKNDRDQISKQIGSLSKIDKTWLPISTPFLDEPRILAEIRTRGHGLYDPVSSMSCRSDSEFWTCQNDNLIRLYNMKGDLVKFVETKSTNTPHDIAVARNGDIVYTAFIDKSINLVSGAQIHTLITLRGWTPLSVCCSVSGDLLVIMNSDGFSQTKVVRYSGSKEKQSIQWDDHGKPLYTSGEFGIYMSITENRNLDICVNDSKANAVVVVNAGGKLRFRYIGCFSAIQKPFRTYGITTDSRANILVAERSNHRIHIIDRDGNFLHYIDSCGLDRPIALSMDTSNNLLIADAQSVTVKKIQYYK